MSPSGIKLNPGAIDTSASAVAARALAIDEVAGAIVGIPLAGLEPRTLGRTMAALERSTKLAQRASGITGRQGPALRKRAQLARAADAGGGGYQFTVWKSGQWMLKVTMNVLDQYSNVLDLEKAGGKAWDAKQLYRGKGPMGAKLRKQFTSWQAMQKRFGKTAHMREDRLKLIRQIHSFNVKRHAIDRAKAEWIKRKGINKRPGFFGKLGGRALKVAGNAVGPVTALATSVYKGEPAKVVAQRVAAAAAGVAVDVAIGAVGGAACAAVTIGSGGPGALACPAIIGASAAVAGIVTTQVIDHQITKHNRPKPLKPVKWPKFEWKPGRAAPAGAAGL